MREYYEGNLNDIDLTKEQEVLLQEPGCGFGGVLDFAKIAPSAQTIKLEIYNALNSENITFGKNVQNFSLKHRYNRAICFISGDWNFAEKIPNLKEISLDSCNMKDVTHLEFGPNVRRVSMVHWDQPYSIPNLNGGWHFGKITPSVEVFDMRGTEFGLGMHLYFGPNAKKICLQSCFNVSMKAPGAQIVDLRYSTINEVDINPAAEVLISDRRGDKDISLQIKDGLLRLHKAVYLGGYRYFRDITK